MPTAPVAYFSMEIALSDDVPTFSGGLGVLAGDHLRAAADAGLPLVGVTLVYHLGFFRQEIDETGRQIEHSVDWRPADHLEPLDARVEVVIGGRNVRVGVWRRVIRGEGGSSVPVYFLDTRLEENDPDARAITDQLYAALKLIDRGTLSASQRGSMHGEIGQTQFLPKTMLEYGAGNLESAAGALNSTANFLKAHGWRAGAGYQPGEPNFAAIEAWNAATVYQQAIALMGKQIDGGGAAAAR